MTDNLQKEEENAGGDTASSADLASSEGGVKKKRRPLATMANMKRRYDAKRDRSSESEDDGETEEGPFATRKGKVRRVSLPMVVTAEDGEIYAYIGAVNRSIPKGCERVTDGSLFIASKTPDYSTCESKDRRALYAWRDSLPKVQLQLGAFSHYRIREWEKEAGLEDGWLEVRQLRLNCHLSETVDNAARYCVFKGGMLTLEFTKRAYAEENEEYAHETVHGTFSGGSFHPNCKQCVEAVAHHDSAAMVRRETARLGKDYPIDLTGDR